MTYSRKLWLWLGAIFVISFAILGLIGREIYVQAPPVPEKVVTASGATIYTKDDIQSGREVWQSMGGMQMGSVWGHGGYVAPDWGADWLHREALALLDIWAKKEFGTDFSAIDLEDQAALKDRLKRSPLAIARWPAGVRLSRPGVPLPTSKSRRRRWLPAGMLRRGSVTRSDTSPPSLS